MRTKKPKEKRKLYLGARLDEELVERVCRLAERERRSVANIIELALRQYTESEP